MPPRDKVRVNQRTSSFGSTSSPARSIHYLETRSLKYRENAHDKPLPVKFLYFNHNDQQFMLELED